MRTRPVVNASLVAVVGLALTACSTSVAVDAPQTSEEVTAVCLEMSRQLPGVVGDQYKRPVDPLDIRTAAWGDPPIVYRCGVATPPALKPTSIVASINGVNWFPQEHTEGFVFTTVKREANIQIDVPNHYAPEANVLTDFSDLIKHFDPEV